MAKKKSTLKSLEEQLRKQHHAASVAIHTLQQQLELKEGALAYSPPYDLINPWQLFYDGQNLIFPVFPSRLDYRTSSSYIWLSESQLDLLRAYARWLYETNSYAKGILKGLANFIIKAGYKYEVMGRRGSTVGKETISKAQKILDTFRKANKWSIRERELFLRSRRDGEWFLRYFPQDDGITQIRVVEPECVRSPNAEPEWTFGIKAKIEDREVPLDYNVTMTGVPSDSDIVDPFEIYHSKINVDLGVKRGLSDFFPTQETLGNVLKLIRADVLGASARAAIAYVREFQQANNQTILALQQANTQYDIPIPTVTGVPQLQPVQQIIPGGVHDIPEGLTYKQGPVSQTAGDIAVLDAALQQLAQFWNVPEWMVTGSSSSGSYANSLTEESPFSRMVEAEQHFQAGEYRNVMMRILEIAVEQGDLSQQELDELEVQVVCPPVVTRQTEKATARNVMLHDKGVLSKRTWSAKEDLDMEHEQQNFKEDEPDFKELDVKPENPDQQPETDLVRK